MKKTLIAIIMFVMLTNVALAFNTKLTNTTDEMMIVKVTWLACDWEGFPPVTLMLHGELQPGETTTMSGDYKAGPWSIEWSGDNFGGIIYEIVVPFDKGALISTPDSVPIFYPGT